MSWGKKKPKGKTARSAGMRRPEVATSEPVRAPEAAPPAEPPAEKLPPAPRERREVEPDGEIVISLPPKASIGRHIAVKGELEGTEDVIVEGRLEGLVSLPQHTITVLPSGRVEADVSAARIVIEGFVQGDLEAERVEIATSGSLIGDVRTKRLVIADGASFRGQIDMVVPDPAEEPSPQSAEGSLGPTPDALEETFPDPAQFAAQAFAEPADEPEAPAEPKPEFSSNDDALSSLFDQ